MIFPRDFSNLPYLYTMASDGAASGVARDERQFQADMIAQQKQRATQNQIQPREQMTAPQHEMITKPDCGEESYVGAGKLRGKVALITGGDSGIGRAVRFSRSS